MTFLLCPVRHGPFLLSLPSTCTFRHLLHHNLVRFSTVQLLNYNPLHLNKILHFVKVQVEICPERAMMCLVG